MSAIPKADTNIDRRGAQRVRNLRLTASVICLLGMIALYLAKNKGMLGQDGRDIVLLVLGFLFLGPMAVVFGIQAVTGLSLRSLSAAWNGLRGWQRGVIGTAVVILSLIFFHLLLIPFFGLDMGALRDL
jgi:hypothetical protein